MHLILSSAWQRFENYFFLVFCVLRKSQTEKQYLLLWNNFPSHLISASSLLWFSLFSNAYSSIFHLVSIYDYTVFYISFSEFSSSRVECAECGAVHTRAGRSSAWDTQRQILEFINYADGESLLVHESIMRKRALKNAQTNENHQNLKPNR